MEVETTRDCGIAMKAGTLAVGSRSLDAAIEDRRAPVRCLFVRAAVVSREDSASRSSRLRCSAATAGCMAWPGLSVRMFMVTSG